MQPPSRGVTSIFTWKILPFFALLSFLLSSCQNTPKTLPTITSQATATFPPTSTPTPEPLGSQNNPLIIGFVSETRDLKVTSAANQLAAQLTSSSGYTVVSQVFSSYHDLISSLQGGSVQISWLPPLTYIYAYQNKAAEVALLTNHFGVYQYGSQFLVNSDQNFQSFFDPTHNQNTANAATALAQFKGLRPCWVDLQSPSGYIIPASILLENGDEFQPGVVTQSSTSVVRALYIKGICDYGVTFAISGDPRTSSEVLQDLPDALNKIVIIWRSDPIIPNLNLSFIPSVPKGIRDNIVATLQDLVVTGQGKKIISDANNYDVQDLKIVDDSIYDPLRADVRRVGIDLQTTLGK
ncbi:MAG TPA: PhnD/SsuA/transferrin family substrate-binding protein [Anaerolineaceae bacterium]|nr:PhnD/SsuA/transferrin family substrate-binding protein [Anaerolineaceae bacterium]